MFIIYQSLMQLRHSLDRSGASLNVLHRLAIVGLTLGSMNRLLSFEIRGSMSVKFVYSGIIELYFRIESKGL